MKGLKSLFTIALLSSTAIQALSWGQKGHDAICFIAENHLTPTAKQAAEALLDGKSIVYYANWMDNASNTPQYKYSKTWHYKNIDEGVEFSQAPLNENGDVVRAIREQTNILTDPNADYEKKSLALKMLVHVVGDIHQPMHMGHFSDLGGNKWNVKFFNSPTNLHSVWDSKLVEAGHKWTYTEWQQQIDRADSARQQEIIADGTPEKWGEECYKIATKVYNATEKDSNISYDYIAQWTPVVESQFLKGGLRLADLLNSIFDPEYKGSNLLVKK